MKLLLCSISILVLCLVAQPAISQQTFYKTYGHNSAGGEGRTIIQTSDGGYYFSYFIYISGRAISCVTKLNCAGDKTWEQFFDNGIYTLPVELIPQDDMGALILLNTQNNLGNWEAVVMKLDSAGNTEWSTVIDHRIDETKGFMKQHSDGRIFLCGSIVNNISAVTAISVVCLNPSGDVLWHHHFSNLNYYTPLGLTITSDGKLAIFGTLKAIFLPFMDTFILTCTLDGNFIKRKTYGTLYDDEPRAICSDNVGNLYLTGKSYFINSEWDIMFLKVDTGLNVIESKFYDAQTPQGDIGRDIIYTNDGNIAIFGDEGAWEQRNLMLLKSEPNGNVIWSKSYGISPNFTNYAYYGTQTSDGGYLMTGDARPAIQFRIAPVLRTDANGELGCYTSPLNLIARNEILVVEEIPVLETVMPITANHTPVLQPTFAIPTFRTNFCSNLLPCGTFASSVDTLCPEVCYNFSQQSLLAGNWVWNFTNGTPSQYVGTDPPVICFSGNGPHLVQLTISNNAGSVTYSQYVNDSTDCPFFLPNIFTPNNDGVNDMFLAKGIYDFSLQIFNRWGNTVFKSNVPGTWWDGKSTNGNDVPDGVYFYILNAADRNEVFKGTVELIR